jgi:hypothetical protein
MAIYTRSFFPAAVLQVYARVIYQRVLKTNLLESRDLEVTPISE